MGQDGRLERAERDAAPLHLGDAVSSAQQAEPAVGEHLSAVEQASPTSRGMGRSDIETVGVGLYRDAGQRRPRHLLAMPRRHATALRATIDLANGPTARAQRMGGGGRERAARAEDEEGRCAGRHGLGLQAL